MKAVKFTVTKAMRRALIAANDQRVFRVYGRDGNVLKSPGIGSRTLWVLLNHRMIEDEPHTSTGNVQTTCRMRLTRAGFAALGKEVAPDRGQTG